jgi:hypothetical protein
MDMNVRELASMHRWGPSGGVSKATQWLIGLACAITMVVAIAGPKLMWSYSGYYVDYDRFGNFERHSLVPSDVRFWVCNGLALVFAVWIAASYLPRWSLSRALRVAVLLPVAHVVLLAAAWIAWPIVSAHLPRLAETAPLVDALPMGWVALGAAVACLAFGWLAAPRREWLHGTVMLALATLLLVGLWLPIGSALYSPPRTSDHLFEWQHHDVIRASLAHAGPWAARMLVPPFVAALAFTIAALRRPALVQRHRSWVTGALYTTFGVSLLTRIDPTYDAALIYINFVHVLLAVSSVAIGALGLLAGSLVWRGVRGRRVLARDPRVQTGEVIAADSPVVARVEITSWLRGPRTELRNFAVTTRAGAIPIPAGAELVAPLSPMTTHLGSGESLEALRAGDRVVIAGLVEPPADHPFRDAGGLIAGTHGVYVNRVGDTTGRFAHLALALWRPCVAYFTIAMVVALLGLVSALG